MLEDLGKSINDNTIDDDDISDIMMEREKRREKIRSYFERQRKDYDEDENENEEDDGNHSDVDQLGETANYQLKERELTLSEKEQQEELELMTAIQQMNLHLKEDIEHHPSSDDDDGDDSDTAYDYYLGQEDRLKIKLRNHQESSLCNNSLSTLSNSILPDEQEKRECFISQNIITYNEVLNLIIIGQSNTGKSLFIKKLLNEPFNDSLLSPTTSLEMHKTTIALHNSKVKLEIWDTCDTIINTELIKTFYKIAHGFICIANVTKEGHVDLSFIEKQLERIISSSSSTPQLFLVLNHRDNYQPEHTERLLNHKKLSELVSKYCLQVRYCNISHINFTTDREMLTYLSNISNSKKLSNCKLSKHKFYSSNCTSNLQTNNHNNDTIGV